MLASATSERAWDYSITSSRGTPQLLPFRNTIGRILKGEPVGYALKEFNQRYAALAASLNKTLEEISFGANVDEDELAAAWAERNDAEGYVLLGDPAVKLRVNDIA